MKILHYTLGLPPYRSGGLTKYSVDLMIQQSKLGHKVYLLYPGHYNFSRKITIKEDNEYRGIHVFELVNPLPVPLLGGVKNPELFMQRASSKAVFSSFLEEVKPDIIHVHTLMGIHKEFFEVAKEKKIKVVFTTHDYYGICPKVNLIDYNNQICTDYRDGQKCVTCNTNAYSFPLIYMMQSKVYKTFKNSFLVKKLRESKKQKMKQLSEKQSILLEDQVDLGLTVQFQKLRDYYCSILESIDYFHFNSSTTKKVYENYVDITGEVIPIAHSGIKDNRILKNYDVQKPLKITFLGPLEEYKGFFLLRKSLISLLRKGKTNWHLNVFGNAYSIPLDTEKDFITLHGRYQYKDLFNIFQETDVLVIPSVWKETFGFIGLEALSYGVPVLVSEHVGFKDIIEDGVTGIIFKADPTELANILEQLIHDRGILEKINRNIYQQDFPYTMDIHVRKIQSLYKKVIGAR
ncbi:glycosyltransferase [Geobacillus stearothermophilus]|uniref:glycosyltransferase n=1 Tax=Geobacillus stearothermophilus TaxID=1422 RepID=UPI003D1D0813